MVGSTAHVIIVRAVAASLVAIGSCAGLTGCGAPPAEPEITRVQLTVSPKNVLAYALALDVDRPATAVAKVTPSDTGIDPWTVEGPTDAAEQIQLVIAGLRAESTYALEITVKDGDGQTVVDSSHSITTDDLPDAFPPIEVEKRDAKRMQAGFTLFDVFGWLPSGGTDRTSGWLVIVDGAGEVVWYAHTSDRPEDARLLPSGNIGYSYVAKDAEGFVELDRMSRQKRRWVATKLGNKPPDGAIPVDVDAIHHEVVPLPNGNFLALTATMKKLGPTDCSSYTEPLNVVGDAIVEFSPKTGKVAHEVSLFDILDPCRRTDHGFAGGFWNERYGGITTKDWTHSNGIAYDRERKLAIVSVRHQDWLVGLKWPPTGNKASDSVAWLLGDEGSQGDYRSYKSFSKTGTPFAWQYHQHAPEVMKNGDILLFDNGNLRPGTNFDPNDAAGDKDRPYSRVVQYHIDTSKMTVRQVWQWKAPLASGGSMYCPFVGDADTLENGNVLATFGGAVASPSKSIADPANRKWGRLVEIARGTKDEIVWDLRVRDPSTSSFKSYTVYRAERISGFPR